MRTLLISANTEQFNMPAMPLGLASVAMASREAGHDVHLLDLMFKEDAETVIQSAINSFQPQCIGISVRNIDDQNLQTPNFLLEKVKEVVQVCRRSTTVPIILGGTGYSMFPEIALDYLEADMGIAGEGELVFPALLDLLENNRDIHLPGLYLRKQGLQQERQFHTELDRTPLPTPEILSSSTTGNKDPWIPVQTRKGCPLKCSYCSTPAIEGTIIRQRSPDRVVNCLKTWVSAGYKNFFFVDNTFNLPRSYAKQLCRLILQNNLKISWWCIVYPKLVDQELVSLMAEAGCRQVSLGFESGSPTVLRNLNKHFSLNEVETISALFGDHGIQRMGFLLLGSPGETRATVRESLDFADSLQLDTLRVTPGVRVYPGTHLAKIAQREGALNPSDNLLQPRFYLAQEMENWLPETLQDWQATRPHVIM